MDNMFESILESNPREESEHEEIKERDTILVNGTYSKATFDPSNSGKSPFDEGSGLNPFDDAPASNATSIKNTIVDSNMMSLRSEDLSMKSVKMEEAKYGNIN